MTLQLAMALAPRRRRVASDDGLLVQKSFHQRNRSLDDVGGFATVLPSARRERQNHVSGRRRAIWSGGFARERPYPPTLTTSMTMAAELTLTAAAAAGSGGPALLLQRRRMYREPSRILLDQPFAELDTSLAAMQVGAQDRTGADNLSGLNSFAILCWSQVSCGICQVAERLGLQRQHTLPHLERESTSMLLVESYGW